MRVETIEEGVIIDVKVVPNSRADTIAGLLGDARKVKVAAPPEGGRANAAVCRLLARTLGVNARHVAITAGAAGPRKRITITGLDAAAIHAKLNA